MKIRSHIAVFLTGLLLVSIGHNIIPHQAHLDEILSHAACHYHATQIYDGKINDHFGAKEEPCQHCLAFRRLNHLISFDKNTRPISVKTIAGNWPGNFLRIDDPFPGEYFICSGREPVPYFSGFLVKTSGLRAPPLSS